VNKQLAANEAPAALREDFCCLDKKTHQRATGLTNDTTKLLGLAGVQVTRVEFDEDDAPIVELGTAYDPARRCPVCGFRATSTHGWVTTRPRDLTVAGRHTDLRWRKQRWLCPEYTCPTVTFTDRIPQVPARARLTERLREAAGAAVGDGGRTVMQCACDHGVSWPVVNDAVHAHAAAVLPAETPQVTALGIDETRRGRKKWRRTADNEGWEVVTDCWHVGFVDLTGGHGLLGQVEGRNAQVVRAWINANSDAWRAGVQYVAIDMCTIFKSAVRETLPDAILVVDRFHVVQLANNTVHEVRRRMTMKHRKRRGRKGNREWELRNRLTRSAAKTKGTYLDPMVEDLRRLPQSLGAPILTAWNAKEDLMDLLALTHTNPTRHQVSHRLTRFYTACADSSLPELERLATTVSTWWVQIEAAIRSGVSNAGSEGHNRVIKTVARDAYGFRNTDNQRLRTRLATTRRGRGCLPRA
jgi:transposase